MQQQHFALLVAVWMLKFWRLHDFVAIVTWSLVNSIGEMNECDEPLSSRTFKWICIELKILSCALHLRSEALDIRMLD